jgi:hypothetical protein
MMAGMSSSIFQEWQLYDRIEPFGEFRAELRHGAQMAMTANLNRDSKVRPEPFKSIDFMHFVDRPPEVKIVLSDADVEMELKGIFGV